MLPSLALLLFARDPSVEWLGAANCTTRMSLCPWIPFRANLRTAGLALPQVVAAGG